MATGTLGLQNVETDIAIVGMAAHVPGAASPSEWWHQLAQGIEAIRHLSEAELLANGESPARMRAANFVPASVILDRFDHFDAEFFGLSPKEAAIMDPQHRQFLEVAWEAMEDAGHPPSTIAGNVGVYAGCGMGSYFYFNLCSNPDLVRSTGMFLLRHTGNDKDFLSTRVSHVFDLKGPSLNVQTACSTSLVAVHLGVQALLNGECDMALAGGVTIELPHGRGYLYQDGEILSPDGHCHAFDHRAQGTVFGSGAGCVVLRRLADALADGDHIWAVIKGSAINNDGAAKAGYLAPSVDGQARAIAEAQAVAGVTADTVGYVECHGTGTWLGDPIEVAALTQAFRETTDKVGYSRIGSVKTNIGHLDTAAGVASLIKTSLALHHGEIPPSLNYESPNPAIDFDGSPFRVNDRLSPFPRLGAPRRAGVNSLGVGGTNAHVVLEEAPAAQPSQPADFPFVPLVVSARTPKALDEATARLAAHLRARPDQSLADVAYTLKEGRHAFDRRRVVVAGSAAEAADLLETGDRHRVFTHSWLGANPDVAFMFPGGGAQYAGMARDLYETEPVFRDWMDRGLAVLAPKMDDDLRALWLPEPGAEAAADAALIRPSVQLPLIMITEYALAQLWQSWGVMPAALIGHSMGENTAACLAGVIGFEDCIGLVHLRGQLFDTIPAGGMLSVPLSEADLRPWLGDDLDLASVNAPGLCVVSGPQAALDRLAGALQAKGLDSQRIRIDIAAHSRMLEPILARFHAFLRGIRLNPPQIPVISNQTGQVLTAEQAVNPDYWVQHLRGTVQFAQGIATLMAGAPKVFLEMGPGRALSSLAQANGVPGNQVLAALRHPDQVIADDVYFVGTLARAWALGVPVDWLPIWGEAPRRRVPLPTYPFQRSRYFIEPGQAEAPDDLPMRSDDISTWGWRPEWRPRAADGPEADQLPGLTPLTWLVFVDETGLAGRLVARLQGAGHRVVTVEAGDSFACLAQDRYVLSPELGLAGYEALLAALGVLPDRIVHGWLVTDRETHRPGSSFAARILEQGFWSLLHLGQALAGQGLTGPLHCTVLTTGAVQVRDEPLPWPGKAAIEGPVRVLPKEVPGLTAATLDLGAGFADDAVLEELLATPGNHAAALRRGRRLALTWRPEALSEPTDLPQGAVVLITGGFGGIGLTLAERLIRDHGARVALLARSPLPPAGDWAAVLARDPVGATADRIRAMQRLQALGDVMAVAGDVCNLEDMQAARAAVEVRFGPVHLLIHAAGVVDDAPVLARSDAAVTQVLAPKIHGTQVLAQVFPDGDLAQMVVFGSSSTVTAPAGQVDYVAANAFVNAWAQSRRGGRTQVLALNWGIWADVGMAANSQRGAERQPLDRPMLDSVTLQTDGTRLYEARWDPGCWWLDGHRTRDGQALLPGTGYLDLLAQISGPAWEVRDLYFLRPLTADVPRTVQVVLSGQSVEIRSDVRLDGRTGWQVNAQAVLMPLAARAPVVDLTAIAARMGVPVRGQGLRSPQEDHLAFGPRWRVLVSTALGRDEGLAELALPEAFHADLAGHGLHPALMDLATGWAMGLIQGYSPRHLWVPVSYGRMRAYGPLPARVFSHVRNAADNRDEAGFACFDITLADPDGRVVVEIEGFRIHRLTGGLSLAPPEVRYDAAERPVSAAEDRLRHNLTQGIRAAEGAEAFLRALSQSGVAVVSSMPLPALIAQSEAQEVVATSQAFDRPELSSDFIAPRNAVEETLAGFWRDLLGVAQVGVQDSFFDLGGHSLIAVRLFAMIRKTWGVDLPISVLFEAPTIAACAALIGPQEGSTANVVPMPKRFVHLVPMQTAGTGTPVFMVAGMFGNVLNLRSLAMLVGQDRPFWGLQARGLYGDAAPHDDFREAARDYIAEMRQVQPSGPWIVGGFSGGGLIAWEIAQQLAAQGEEVQHVILLDTPLPVRRQLTRQDRALIRLGELRRDGAKFFGNWWRAKQTWNAQQRLGAQEIGAHQLDNAAVEAAFRAALPRYDLAAWHGPVTLLRPPLDRRWRVSGGQWVSTAREYVYEDNQWRPWAPDLRVIEVPGDHDSMVLEPNVRVMAARLRQILGADMALQKAAE